jgi:hypothetical protein
MNQLITAGESQVSNLALEDPLQDGCETAIQGVARRIRTPLSLGTDSDQIREQGFCNGKRADGKTLVEVELDQDQL